MSVECPYCDGRGWNTIAVHDPTDPDGDPLPEQEQCATCGGSGEVTPDPFAVVEEALRPMDHAVVGSCSCPYHIALAALQALREERGRLRFCPYCAHGYEWQDSDPVEGPCAGCRRAEQAEAENQRLREALAVAIEDILLMESPEGDSPRNIAGNLRAALGDEA